MINIDFNLGKLRLVFKVLQKTKLKRIFRVLRLQISYNKFQIIFGDVIRVDWKTKGVKYHRKLVICNNFK